MKLVRYKTKFKLRRFTGIKHFPPSSQNAIKQLFKLKLRFEYITEKIKSKFPAYYYVKLLKNSNIKSEQIKK